MERVDNFVRRVGYEGCLDGYLNEAKNFELAG